MADASTSAAGLPEPESNLEPNFEAWEAAEEAVGTQEALVISLDGFEGPLDVLLALARTQKVDLAKISVLALADQYLVFIAQAQSCIVRRSVTAMCRQPCNGSKKIKRLHTPLRWYS